MLDLDLPIRCHIIHIATSVTSGFGICWNLRLLSARPNTKGPWVDHDKTSSWWVIMWHDGDTMWQGLYFCLYELWPVSRMANVDGDVEMSSNPKGHNSTSAVCRLWSHRFIQSSFWLRHSYGLIRIVNASWSKSYKSLRTPNAAFFSKLYGNPHNTISYHEQMSNI